QPELKIGGPNPYAEPLGRTNAFPLSMIWYGRTLTERENYDEAEFHFRNIWEDSYLPKSLHDELYTAEAHLFIKQKKYEKAIDPLKKAIDLTKNKRKRARLAFILAQIYDRAGQYEQAFAAYDKVLRSNPKYDMEFNARLQQTFAGWANGKIASADATKTLERMLKDDKNLDYRDQIYFTLATIALKDNRKQDGIAFLRKSLNYNQGNNPQRAESYLKLADLYFEAEEFVQAKNYYDSTLTVLAATDERFKRATDYANNLKDIARLIQTIAANDSIVRIFNMNPEQRKEFGKALKKQREAAAAAKAAAKPASTANAIKALTPQAGQRASSFYFYNEAFVKKGKKDFNKAWGDRKLEDNWRRSNRISSATDGLAGIDSTQTESPEDVALKDIFANIPKTEDELTVLHLATYEAMFQLGTLFRDKLQHNVRCVSTLEELQTRYPDTARYEKETWYYCYLAHNDLTNADRAKFYLEKLKGKYPNSAFARALTDPNFLNASKEKERDLNKYYEETFTLFQNGVYKDAYDRCLEAPKKFGSQNPLVVKFALLSALCVGNLNGNDAYCAALGEVISRYPNSAEATRAREIARLLSCKGFETDDKKKTETTPIDDAFTREDDKLHYFIISLKGDNVRLDDVKSAVSDYNRENHKLEQLRISNIFLGTDTSTPIIVIRKFDSKEQAMRYYEEVSNRKDFLGETAKKTYNKEFFSVTQENYRRILKNKTLDGYREFFQENYLKK
ncbi:MAG: tetratricopeptide repeat protein, partial [Saprospiraceae bacterium]|nr:tetratricopeptide repeat protein [Saprospiraceae bacterium]